MQHVNSIKFEMASLPSQTIIKKVTQMNGNKFITTSLIVLVYVVAITLSSYLEYVEELEKISIGYRSSATQKIKTSALIGEQGTDNLKYMFESKNIDDYIIFDDSLNNPQLRGILVKGNVNSPKIIKGRFFNETDFFVDKKIVVIGENMIKYTFQKNDKRYLPLFNDTYEVIGICGYGSNGIIENIIFYNLDSLCLNDWGMYSIDGNSTNKTNLIINKISDFGEIETIINEDQGIKRLLGYNSHFLKVSFSITLLILLLFLLKSRSFFLMIQKTLHICRFLGFSFYQAICITLGKWALYEGIGIISVMSIYSISFVFFDFTIIINGFSLRAIFVAFSLFICSFVAYIVFVGYLWSKREL